MKMSENISQLATALSKAQGEIDDATKKGVNPAFRSKYADLAAVRGVIREPLAVNDLSIVQFPRTIQGGVEVETMTFSLYPHCWAGHHYPITCTFSQCSYGR